MYILYILYVCMYAICLCLTRICNQKKFLLQSSSPSSSWLLYGLWIMIILFQYMYQHHNLISAKWSWCDSKERSWKLISLRANTHTTRERRRERGGRRWSSHFTTLFFHAFQMVIWSDQWSSLVSFPLHTPIYLPI